MERNIVVGLLSGHHRIQKGDQKDTPRFPQSWPGLPVPGIFLALIREKCALMFGDSLDSLLIRQSGAISELKTAANSIYWEAKLAVI